jgi:hypothetical protein
MPKSNAKYSKGSHCPRKIRRRIRQTNSSAGRQYALGQGNATRIFQPKKKQIVLHKIFSTIAKIYFFLKTGKMMRK